MIKSNNDLFNRDDADFSENSEYVDQNDYDDENEQEEFLLPIKKQSVPTLKDSEDPDEMLLLYQKTHDVVLRNKIVMHFSSIAKTVAFQMRGIFSDYAQIEDIVNQGILALIECVERFDSGKQVKFQTFAFTRVRGSVIDFVRKQDWIPRRVRVAAKNINRAHDELCTELMREPKHDEIAARLNMTPEVLNKYYSEISGTVTLSFENSIQGLNYSDMDISEPVDRSSSADSGLFRQELKELISSSIQSLSEREQQVISLYYYEELKQSEIAQVLQISEQRVSQLISKAIQKIRFKVEGYMTDS